MNRTIMSNSVLKRKLYNVRNDDKISIDNKRMKIQEIEDQMIYNIQNNNRLSDIDKNTKIKELIIRNIQRDNTISNSEKMVQYNNIMIYDYKQYIKKKEEQLPLTTYKRKSYNNRCNNILGCTHYKKNCKINTSCCNKWYVCKFCHNEKEYHQLSNDDITRISCMECYTIQPVSNRCINKNCNIEFGKYFCKICNYHNNEDEKFFHCRQCKICIKGDKKEFKHCKKCNMCLHISIINNHRCIDNRNSSTCPICNEKIKDTSDMPMILESCQHVIHANCFSEYMTSNYKCPVCMKTITDFGFYSSIFDLFDEKLEYERNQIPEEFKNAMVKIFCNDCEQKTETTWHFELHKCQNDQCNSFNTSILSVHKDYYDSDSNNEENSVNTPSNSSISSNLSDQSDQYMDDINIYNEEDNIDIILFIDNNNTNDSE